MTTPATPPMPERPGIAEVSPRAGLDVRVVVSSPDRIGPASERILRALDRAVAKGRMTTEERTGAADRLRFAVDPAELADRQLVVEAVAEELKTERRVFKALDAAVTDPAAARMDERGAAGAEDVDRGMTLGRGHPMGPLALLDMIGIDTVTAVARSMRENSDDLVDEVPPPLFRMVEDGRLGRKAGRGFFRYDGTAS
ncbi:3-hydroxyacyl-CoA dehydrogenase family protein [Streptomyces wedmorensis]|uniref:3-hydroxyacyl-CoA dehydrogenase family protein n=1 Tax=Streptomyces wedmorensis TaxID=43759 RepID=A0ABW6J451_STRWE